MKKLVVTKAIRQMALLTISACLLLPFAPAIARAQLITFSNQDLLDYTAQNPFGRLPDGRPKVPDDLIERARGLIGRGNLGGP